jgi:hypothetical protein
MLPGLHRTPERAVRPAAPKLAGRHMQAEGTLVAAEDMQAEAEGTRVVVAATEAADTTRKVRGRFRQRKD